MDKRLEKAKKEIQKQNAILSSINLLLILSVLNLRHLTNGYKNDNLKARITGSTSSFEIKGDRVKKDAVKIHIDYNVQTDIGYIYGLEGTYITNSKENNVKIGIKGGYVF